jgi:two-component system chemotaxis response regulator CheY
MELVIENAEEEIRTLVEDMENLPIAWRAIHCFWPDAAKYQLEDLSNKLTPILGEDDSYIFQWGQEDIFIIAKGTRKEPLENARSTVESFSRDMQRIPQDELYKVSAYDLSIGWSEFREFFEFREKEIAKEESQTIHESIQRQEKEEEIKLIKMDFTEKKIELQRRTMRPDVTVLAVDADPNTLSLVDSICKGYKVLRAENGEEALEKYFDEAPDIVIMDTQLAVIDGWEVVQYIYDYDDKAFVIMVTANTDEGEVQRAIEFGVKGIVKKPFSQGKIEQYLEKYKSTAPMHKRVEDTA